MSDRVDAIRGDVLTFTGDPFLEDVRDCVSFVPDAIVVMRGGRIADVGPAAEVAACLAPGVRVAEYPGSIVLPGFVDCHVHYAQTPILGASGEHLTDWLDRRAFVAEQAFHDVGHARAVAGVFLRECLRAGTTTAAVFCTVHPQSVDAFFEESSALGMRNVAGKVLMDRNAPAGLTDTPRRAYDESAALIRRWHGKGRQLYAVTPRFAPACSPAELEVAGALWSEHAGTYLQSHVSETADEVGWVRELYPERSGYLDVYEHFGLVGPRAVFGHGVHLTEGELLRCHETGTAIAHCPTSNLFLGSGLFDLGGALRADRPVRVGLATDLGAGTSFSMLRTMGAAHAVARARGAGLSALRAFYLATRGAARALYLDDAIGSVATGMEADLVVLDLHATPVLEYRMGFCEDLEARLFALMTLGDERATRATYVAGVRAYDRDAGASAG